MNIDTKYDELIFIKDEKFASYHFGSLFGEIKCVIYTPFVTMVNLDYYDIENNGDYVYVDKNFCLDEYLYVQSRYNRVIRRTPLGLRKNTD